MTGWIYVMSNPSMPGLIKIGMSAQDPKEYRVKELSQATGVPEPFVVQYQALVDDERTAEKQLHSYFSGYRHNKEFFKDLSVATVITMAREHLDIRHEENLLVSDEQIKHEKLSQQKAQEERDREEERNRQAQQKKREAGWLSDIAEGRERFEKWFAASQDQRLKEDKHITEVVVGKAGKKNATLGVPGTEREVEKYLTIKKQTFGRFVTNKKCFYVGELIKSRQGPIPHGHGTYM